jgi:DNA-binding response OmpR family regulator
MTTRAPSILIVDHDRRRGAELRDRLVKDRVEVDVVNSLHAALAVGRCKPVAVAIVCYADDPQTRIVCEELRRLGIPTLYRHDPSDAHFTARGVRWLRQ